jgi:PAS domain S-box-containing protein
VLALATTTGQILWQADAEGGFIEPAAWCAFTGQPPIEARGDGWREAIHPDERPHIVAAWRHALHAERLDEIVYRLRRLDGIYRLVAMRGTPIRDEAGQVRQWVGMCVDITETEQGRRLSSAAAPGSASWELLELQQRAALSVLLRAAAIVTTPALQSSARSLLTALSQALFDLEAADIVHAMLFDEESRRVEPLAMYGVSSADEAAWREGVRQFQPLASAAAQPLMARLRVGLPIQQRFDERPGVIVPGMVESHRVRAAITAPVLVEGRLVGVITIGRTQAHAEVGGDVFAPWDEDLLVGVGRLAGEALAQGQLVAQLTTAEARRLAAEEATRQRDEFMIVASHELRTPLTTISASTQLIERRLRDLLASPDQPAEVLLQRLKPLEGVILRANRQAGRLGRLVGDLLDVSRLQSGKLEMRRMRLDLAARLREAVLEQRQIAPDRAIRLSVPAKYGAMVTGDADRLTQVLVNYLGNARKYSPPDRPIKVRLRLTDGVARVEVRDEGPGLSQDEREQIWERFHRAPDAEVLAGSEVGLGLGLYICRGIIERHGGETGVESAPGHGATFWFTLPLADGHGRPPDAPTDAARP